MIINLSLVLIIVLAIISIVDLKFKKIPSILLTGILFVVAMIQLFTPSGLAHFHLAGGIAFLIIAWLLYEADFIGGLADVKVLVIIGMMINSYPMLLVGVLLTMLFGFAYKLVFRYAFKKKKEEEVPFIPCLFYVYCVLLIVEVFI